MIIALDYDDTYTADPEFWKTVILAATRHKHIIICVTARYKTIQNQQELKLALPDDVDIYFSGDEPKMDYMRRNNIVVDVWIDDSPGWIVGIT